MSFMTDNLVPGLKTDLDIAIPVCARTATQAATRIDAMLGDVRPAPVAADLDDAPSGIVAGTLVDVVGGQIPVEKLRVGDKVRTLDGDFAVVRWIARRRVSRAALQANPALRPVLIEAGSMAEGVPARDLRVAPQHNVLLSDWRCELLFGEDEVLAPAAALANGADIGTDPAEQGVTYYDLMFDKHEVILCDGLAVESYRPVERDFDRIAKTRSAELLSLFPQLASGFDGFGPQARATLKPHEAEVLLAM